MENTFKVKDLRVRQDRVMGKLYISVNDESYMGGRSREFVLSQNHEIFYEMKNSTVGDGYMYDVYEDSVNYGNVYDFETTYNRLIGGEIDSNQSLTTTQLRVLEYELNKKYLESYSFAFVASDDVQAKFKFLKPGEILIGRIIEDKDNISHGMYRELTTLDAKHRIFYSYQTGQYYYINADRDAKLLINFDKYIKEVEMSDLEGVKTSNSAYIDDIPRVSFEAVLKNKELSKAGSQPGDTN